MTSPAVVSVARIKPDLARRSWARVRRLVARDDPGGASDDLRCFIAVFRHGDGVPESIERVRLGLAKLQHVELRGNGPLRAESRPPPRDGRDSRGPPARHRQPGRVFAGN